MVVCAESSPQPCSCHGQHLMGPSMAACPLLCPRALCSQPPGVATLLLSMSCRTRSRPHFWVPDFQLLAPRPPLRSSLTVCEPQLATLPPEPLSHTPVLLLALSLPSAQTAPLALPFPVRPPLSLVLSTVLHLDSLSLGGGPEGGGSWG